MKLKLAVLFLYALGLGAPVAFMAGPSSGPDEPEQAAEAAKTKIIKLDEKGRRGVVFFDHRGHEGFISPDPEWPHKAKVGAACVGCHHQINARGIPQLWKCNVCHHRREGDPRNPKNADFDEVMAERAFHDTCIGCHRASKKGPITCGGCHKFGVSPDAIGND